MSSDFHQSVSRGAEQAVPGAKGAMSQTLFMRRASAFLSQGLSPLTGRGARVFLCLLLWTFLACQLPGPVAAETGEAMPKVLRAGFLRREFSDLDPRDAKAAIEVQLHELNRSLGLRTTPQVTVFSDMPSMSAALRRGELEVVTMPGIEYLKLRKTNPLIPAFVVANNSGGVGMRYVIITRKDSGIRSFADLKGRSLLLPALAIHDLGQLWLDVLLLKAGKGARGSFFGQIKEPPRLFNAIMGVFLRQADAAVVTRAALEVSRQLNPQLEAELTIVAESRSLNDGVVCLIPGTPEKFRNQLYKEMMHINETTGGRQMYTVFKSNGVRPFTAACLEGLEELVNDYDRLKGLSGRRK
jgi:ABC-type phosphate/phosphonate transport system substrate-binding protein